MTFCGREPTEQELSTARTMLMDCAANGFRLVMHDAFVTGLLVHLMWGLEFSGYYDTRGYLRLLGLEGSLRNAAQMLGLGATDGRGFDDLHPGDVTVHERVSRHCAVRAELTRELYRKAKQDPLVGDLETYANDWAVRTGLNGILIDSEFAASLGKRITQGRDEVLERIATNTPGFNTSILRSPAKVTDFVAATYGIRLTTLDRKDPATASALQISAPAQALLANRHAFLELDKAGKKLKAVAAIRRAHAMLVYHGAHTGRFSASGREAAGLNLQNMSAHAKGELALLNDLRHVLVPEAHESFVVCDLATIEPRILAFIAGDQALLSRFRAGEDVYAWFGREVFGDRYLLEPVLYRLISKRALIGLGYGMGLGRFEATVVPEVGEGSRRAVQEAFGKHRQLFSAIHGLRRLMMRQFDACWTSRTAAMVRPLISFRAQVFGDARGLTIDMSLPTGRRVRYQDVTRTSQMSPEGQRLVHQCRDTISLVSGVPKSGGVRKPLTPQRLVENLVQATARDLLVAQMRDIEAAGLRVVFSVHDEVVVATPRCPCLIVRETDGHRDDCPWVRGRQTVRDIMSRVPASLQGLTGLPVACAVSATIRTKYGKG